MHFIVDTPNDVVSQTDGRTSLREAITAAAESGIPSIITFDPAVFGMFMDDSGKISSALTVQLLARIGIPEGADIVIDGSVDNGLNVLIQAGGDRFFDIMPGASVVLRDMTLGSGQAAGSNGAWGHLEVDGLLGAPNDFDNNGGDGERGHDSAYGGTVGDTAVAGIENAGSLTLERVEFYGLSASAGNGGRGGDGSGGGDGGDARNLFGEYTGELAVGLFSPNANVEDNALPVFRYPSAPGKGGAGGDGGDGSDGGNGGNAVGAILNTGNLVLRDVSFTDIAADGGDGGRGGSGGAGGWGGLGSVLWDPITLMHWGDGPSVINVVENQSEFDAYDWEIPGSFPPGDYKTIGVIDLSVVNPNLTGNDRYYPIVWSYYSGYAGAGGNGGSGGDGGGGGMAVSAVFNVGNVKVEGAQSDVLGGTLTGGDAGGGGSYGTLGVDGNANVRHNGLDVQVYDVNEPRPQVYHTHIQSGDPTDPDPRTGTLGQAGATGDTDDFYGTTVNTVTNSFYVEAIDTTLEEGQTPRFKITRTGDYNSSSSVAYTLTFSDGLDADDFDGAVSLTGSVSIPPGMGGAFVSLPELLSDGIPEGVERMTLTLQSVGTSGGLGYTTKATILVGDTGSPPHITLGTDGDDVLFAMSDVEGGDGNDRIFGSTGDDHLSGDAGDDFIRPDSGNDTVSGGSGADIFSFANAFGADTITDFNPAEDRIQIDVAFADLTIVQSGSDTLITPASDADGRSILLQGVDASTITESLFDYVEVAQPPETAPVTGLAANPDSFTTLRSTISGNLFADNGAGADSASAGGTLRIVSASDGGTPIALGTPVTLASGGVLTLQSDGSFTYDPALAFGGSSGIETLSYTVADQDAIGRPSSFEPVVDVTTLAAGDGTLGTQIERGYQMSFVGDVSGDGIDDAFLITDDGSGGKAGYLIYGKADGSPFADGTFDPATLDFGDGSVGTKFSSSELGGFAHFNAGGGSDFNDDGIGDFIIAGENGSTQMDTAYVVYGASGGLGGHVDLAALATGDGSAGFAVQTGAGRYVSSIAGGGDVNGDNVEDFIIGAPTLSSTGAALVLLGGNAGWAGTVTASALKAGDGSMGYALAGFANGENAGYNVQILDDINGDGIDDIAVNAPNAAAGPVGNGRVFVLYGNDNAFGENDGGVILEQAVADKYFTDRGTTTLPGQLGFSINPPAEFSAPGANEFLGLALTSADINGDGRTDIIFDSNLFGRDNEVFVLFGSDTSYPLVDGKLDFNAFRQGDTSLGITLHSSFVGDVTNIGDVNGDGVDDLLLASGDDARLTVFYGSNSGFDLTNGSFDLDTLATGDGTHGFVVSTDVNAVAGGQTSLSLSTYDSPRPGDFDGDGVDDIIIGGSTFYSFGQPVDYFNDLLFGRGAGSGTPGVPTATADVSIRVGSVPIALTAPILTFSVSEDSVLSADLGDGSDFALVGTPGSGSVSIDANGAFVYTPNADFAGKDQFAYTVNGTTGLARVSVLAVDDAPTPVDDVATTDEAHEVIVDVLANDSDPEGDALSISVVTKPSRGTVTIDQGRLIFDPGTDFRYLSNGARAQEMLTVTVSDGVLTTTSQLAVTVTGTSGNPLVMDDVAETRSGTPVAIDVLANDSPTNGSGLTLTSASLGNGPFGADAGTVAIVDGRLVFTPDAAFTGDVVIDYTVDDGGVTGQGMATVSVTVPPDGAVAHDDAVTLGENDTITADVLANDDVTANRSLSIMAIEQSFGGTAEVNGGSIAFDPGTAFDFLGEGKTRTISIPYRITDGVTQSFASLNLTIEGANDAPVAVNDSADVAQGSTVAIDALANDTDVENDLLQLVTVGTASHGTVRIEDGMILFTADSDYLGQDSFTYTISDGAATSQASVTMMIQEQALEVNITGTDQVDVLLGNALDNVIDALAGDDRISGLGGADKITGGPGADTLVDTLANLDGDSWLDFGPEDATLVSDAALVRADQKIVTTSGGVTLDLTDGTTSAHLGLNGTFADGDFMFVARNDSTRISFEQHLTQLAERKAVATANINGVVNPEFLTGDGHHAFTITLEGSQSVARQHNALGVCEIAPDGTISNVRILFDDVKDGGTVTIEPVADGNELDFFLVVDGADWAHGLSSSDVLSFIDSGGDTAMVSDGSRIKLAVNGTASSEQVLHMIDALNSDGQRHVLSGVDSGGGGLYLGFEDLIGGGDRDFNDVVFHVSDSLI